MTRRIKLARWKSNWLVLLGLPLEGVPPPSQWSGTEEFEVWDGREDVEAALNRQPVQLCGNPKLLRTLWDECIRGIGRNKPAKDFTREEQGQVKSKHSQRKPFWDCVLRLVATACSAGCAIQKIENTRVGKNLTFQLKCMNDNENRDGHNCLMPNSRFKQKRRGRNSGPNQ